MLKAEKIKANPTGSPAYELDINGDIGSVLEMIYDVSKNRRFGWFRTNI